MEVELGRRLSWRQEMRLGAVDLLVEGERRVHEGGLIRVDRRKPLYELDNNVKREFDIVPRRSVRTDWTRSGRVGLLWNHTEEKRKRRVDGTDRTKSRLHRDDHYWRERGRMSRPEHLRAKAR